MRLVRLVLFTLACLPAALPHAQSHPDFSGTWVEDERARTFTPPLPDSGGQKAMTLPPMDTVVTQTAAALTSERTFMSQIVRYAYQLDGKESVNHNGANTLTTRSVWDGKKLVTQGTSFSVTSAGESLWQFKENRWLDQSGAMVTETTHKDEAGTVTVVTQVFRRK
jgi:hypothetical protein